jgi:hypothetical protein
MVPLPSTCSSSSSSSQLQAAMVHACCNMLVLAGTHVATAAALLHCSIQGGKWTAPSTKKQDFWSARQVAAPAVHCLLHEE